MSSLIIDPTDNRKLVDPAYDRLLDSPATKRELQGVIDHFAKHLDALYQTLDTQHIVINFLGEEKLNVTKEELLSYVAKKRQEIQDLMDKKAQEAAPQEAANEQSNG